jgi:cyclopropane-fatty-acyl-phospholipid synthase
MPRAKAAWAAWNFLSGGSGDSLDSAIDSTSEEKPGVCLTYWLNALQNLGDVPFPPSPSSKPPAVLVTLNPPSPPKHVVAQWTASHPVPSAAAAAAKTELPTLFDSGGSGLFFAGAYAGFGFHEDGVKSGLSAAFCICPSVGAALQPDVPPGGGLALRPDAHPLRLSPLDRLAKASCSAFLAGFVKTGQLVVEESGAPPLLFGTRSPPPAPPPSPSGGGGKRPRSSDPPPAPPPPSPFGDVSDPAALRVVIRVANRAFYWKLATRADLGLADAFVDGDVTVEPSLMALLCLCIANRDAQAAAETAESNASAKRLSLRSRLFRVGRRFLSTSSGVVTAAAGLTAAHWRHLARSNSVSQARRNISAHYDLSNDMFSLFLSPDMTYSCAIFDRPEEALQAAQLRKLTALAELARLKPGMHVLEIGFGWGSLTLLLVKRYGVKVTGITLSTQQLALAQQRVDAAGVSHLVSFHLADYRVFVPPAGVRYDRTLSCEMLEAVGHEFIPAFFGHCARLMSPQGLLVIQVITTPEYRYDAYRRSTDFIKEYIFPGCCCPSLTAVTAAAGTAMLSLDSCTDIGPHYAPTLLRWRQAFVGNRERLHALGFSEAFVRCWDYYFQYCAAGFATRTLGDLQLVFSAPGNVAALGGVEFREERPGPAQPLWW